MSLSVEVLEGTLNPDGSLELDSQPNLPPGRVRVTIQSGVVGHSRKMADVFAEIQASQLARGFHGRTIAEEQAEAAERAIEEEEYERRMEIVWSQTVSGSQKANP